MEVRFKKLTATAKMPTRAHATDAGMDLYVDSVETLYDPVLGRQLLCIHSGIAMEIPKGYFGDLRSRSSVWKSRMMLTSGCSVIDSNYRGEITAIFKPWDLKNEENLSERIHYPQIGERFAQLIIMPYPDIELVEAEELTTSDRGEGGYGSTGK